MAVNFILIFPFGAMLYYVMLLFCATHVQVCLRLIVQRTVHCTLFSSQRTSDILIAKAFVIC